MSAWNRPDPNKAERDRQLVELRAKAPLRRPAVQFDDTGLGLFDHGRQETLL